MEYTINKLAKLAGISTRTLRYYDELGLLSPVRFIKNGFVIFGMATPRKRILVLLKCM